mmetsp:Transcript_10723/g.12265  ORF Transcript_10723/g.12265 Transcript_10723/m.12265 type:complete len:97 (-) Transcript_10723:896-1186(-)
MRPTPVRSRQEQMWMRRRMDESLLWNELNYRAGRIHYYHPRYVTTRMVEDFQREPRETYLSRHKHLLRPKNTSSGTGRTKKSYGGGRSSGGGGGRW